MDDVTILDYGVGNVGSLLNMFKKIGVTSNLASNVQDLKNAKKILLPGVGSFDHGMIQLTKSGMRDTLEKMAVDKKIPTLGICLGAQMLGYGSEEGKEKGLGWLPIKTKRFSEKILRVPHMGWNVVCPQKDHFLFENMPQELRFYFVHSYYMAPLSENLTLATSIYGKQFSSMVHLDHIVGAQFHPEKSHHFGLSLLKNFVQLC